MAEKIEPGAPQGPQHRVQRMDEHGNFVPVPDEPQVQNPTVEDARGFKIGDRVNLIGRVLEVQSPQGGQTSVKVQTASGAAWLQGEHLETVDESEAERRAALEYQVGEHQKQGAKDAERIAGLEAQLQATRETAGSQRAQFEAQIAELKAAQKSKASTNK